MEHHRICITGNSGSGKSSLAKQLGHELGIPVYHLDRHLLTGNFEKLPDEQYKHIHMKLISGADWIIDGNYKKVLDERLSRATLVIFLNVSRTITLPRVLRRVREGGQPVDTVPDGARREQLTWEFLKWVLTYNRHKRINDLRKRCLTTNTPLLVLTDVPVRKWLEQIEQELQPQPN